MKRPPPLKQKGKATGRRRLNGTVLGVRETAEHFFGSDEGFVRARIARGQLPFRKLGGRLVFIRAEVEAFLAALPGVTAEEALANVQRGRPTESGA